ncbi:unnamed protein product [Trichobilharzia regenti]|nr:unnamed protein product [Trichobilharzia regenti]
MFRGYLKSVTSLVKNATKEDSDDTNSSKNMCETQDSERSPSSENLGGYFNWIPNLLTSSSESSVLYYMNSLASLGVSKNGVNDDEPSRLEEFEEDKLSASKDLNTDWMGGISAKTTRQIKQDFSEVVHSVSEPKDVVYRTASSFRDHITAAANTVKNIDPNEFLLPDIEEKADKQQPTGNETDESGKKGLFN